MTRPRSGAYVWVTWLSRLMAGDTQCHWAPWFRAHYAEYAKAPSNFQLATWTVEHNKCLDNLCKECSNKSLAYFKENQNSFNVRRGTMTLGGKPDLIVLEKDNSYTVCDVKTGEPRASDVIQVMLYMAFLPYSTSGRYLKAIINGRVIYKNSEVTLVPSESINETFMGQITHFLNIIEAAQPPPKVPSHRECQYCDITQQDCDEKILNESSIIEGPDLPM